MGVGRPSAAPDPTGQYSARCHRRRKDAARDLTGRRHKANLPLPEVARRSRACLPRHCEERSGEAISRVTSLALSRRRLLRRSAARNDKGGGRHRPAFPLRPQTLYTAPDAARGGTANAQRARGEGRDPRGARDLLLPSRHRKLRGHGSLIHRGRHLAHRFRQGHRPRRDHGARAQPARRRRPEAAWRSPGHQHRHRARRRQRARAIQLDRRAEHRRQCRKSAPPAAIPTTW